MKKSLILTFVFAAISFAGAFAQNTRPAETQKPKQEKQVDKSTPSSARPRSETPTTQPSGQTGVEKSEKGMKNGKGKKKGHFKAQKGKAKGQKKGQHGHDAKGEHEGHDHGKAGESNGRRSEDNKKNTEKNGRTPVETPSSGRPPKQGEKN